MLDNLLQQIKLPFDLKPKQRDAIENIAQFDRGGLFTDVGTGKTVMATLIAMIWRPRKVFIAMPPILLDQWADWLESIGQKDVSIYRGPRRKPDQLDHAWVLMSHNVFRDSFEQVRDRFDASQDVLIMEEAHALKNPGSQLFKKVGNVLIPKGKVILLTGTPTSNPGDGYAYTRIKTPAVYRSKGHFDRIHVAERDIYNNVTKWKDIDLLSRNLHLQAVKLTKEDIFGDTPDPIYTTMSYRLDPAHEKLYNQLAEEQLLLLTTGDKIDATTATRLYHALQQIVVNWSHFAAQDKRPAAFDLLDEVIESTQCMDKSKTKLSVWVNYRMTNEAVVKYLRAKFGDRAIAAAYGDVDSSKGVHAIMNDPECRILVAHPKSAGVGLNMQHVSHEMLFLEASTVPMEMKQTIGRIDRAGQTKVPHIRFAQAKGTIQVKLFRDLLSKDDLVSHVERSPKSLRNSIYGS